MTLPPSGTSELDELIGLQSGPVLVALLNADDTASVALDEALQAVENRSAQLHLLRLPFADYAEWARTHGVYGYPALVLFDDGTPRGRRLGRLTAAEIEALLARADARR